MIDINLEFLETDFTIIEKLGSGGMGQVFKAHQKSMDRLVAIKILQIDLCQNLVYIERFKREARLAGKFCHPNGVQVFDIGCNQGQYYYIMEYVNGTSLREKLRNETRFEEKFVINVLKQVLSVLKEAEKMKIIHRDIKPDNLMFTDEGVVKLADLGIAREINDDAGLTIQNIAIGTPQYMAPEQAQGKPIDLRADQYSLGISAFHMLTGRTPFTGKTTMEILVHHVKSPMIKPSSICQGISPQMDKVILKMTEKDPSKRFQTIDEIIANLDNIGAFLKTKKTTKRKKLVKMNAEQTARIEKRKESNSFSGILILLGVITMILGGYIYFKYNPNIKSDLKTVEKSISIANRLIEENKWEESLASLKIALGQLPPSEQKDILKKINEIEKIIADSLVEKIMVVAFDSVANCEKGIKELELVIEKYQSNAVLANSKKATLQTRISQINTEENRLIELNKVKAKEEAINNLSLTVNEFLFSQKYKQAMEVVGSFKEKNAEENPKIKQLVESIVELESEYGKNVFAKVDTYILNKNFDQCNSYLNSIKENFYQSNLVAKIEIQIQKLPQLKMDYEKEITKRNRLEFSQMKDAIFNLLKIAEIKAAKAKLESYKANGLSEASFDFLAIIIENYSQIYRRIDVGLKNEFKDQLFLNRMGNRIIDAYITSVKNGVINYTFMDNKLELTVLNEEWAQTYTAIAIKITRQNKSCRMLRVCHFAYANGDLEGAYNLMKEAESLGLEKKDQDKYTKLIKEDYLNWLDIQFDRMIEKANSLLAGNYKSRANQLLNDFIKKYGESVIYKERKDEIDKLLALTILN